MKKNIKRFFIFVGMIFLSSSLFNCKMLIDKFTKQKPEEKKEVLLDSMNWAKTSIDLKVGSMDNILLTVKPESKRADAIIVYQYDSSIINLTADSRGVIIEGLKQGKTILTAQNGKITTTCIINVSGYDENYQKEPYIYSSSNIIQLKPGTQERVAVSLYGGSAEDSQKFNWTSEKPSVAEIVANGQFCLIKAVSEGNSKITITHPKAAYPFSLLVYSLPDTQNATFITTNENVISLQKDKGEKTISVVMQNPPDHFSPSLYKWELVKKDGEEICSIDSNADKAVITPLNAGTCLLKVSHSAASYPLEILVRVTEIVKNVYIEPSDTFIEISGSEAKNATVKLKGYTDNYDINDFSWSIENNEVIECMHFANEISISGKKNGMAKITVNHPLAAYPRDIMVKVANQTSDAVDASMYITTSQNYIRTKVGADTIPLNILLAGGEVGDQQKFVWHIKHNPKIQGKDVIKFETTHGTVSSRFVLTYEDGSGYITPLHEGSAVIQISHPKILYPTEILVKVLPEYAVLEEPLYFAGDALIKLLNNTEKEVNINLLGKNKKENDNEAIKWHTDSSNIQIAGASEKCLIKAVGQGSHISILTITHPRVEAAKKITVLTADTQEELDKMKVLYAYKQNYKIKQDESLTIIADQHGFTEEEIKKITYSSSPQEILRCEPYVDPQTNETLHLAAKITALKIGEAQLVLKSNITGVADLIFTITVIPKNANLDVEPDEAYFTTFQNVVSLKTKDDTAHVEVSAIGLSSLKQNEIKWDVENDEIVTVQPNANKALFSAKKEGETKVFISHPECQNKLTIYVRVGNEFIFKPDNTIYIATNTDTLLMVKDEKPTKITAQLVSASGALLQQPNFSFSIDNHEIATINASDNGTCLVSPKKAGQAMISITHPKSAFTKNIILIIANSKEELEGIKYLTTAHNVINITKGQSKNISVTVMNAKETIVSGFEWQSERPDIANINPSGATAVLTGNEVGTTKIKVSNTECPYPLELIVVCIDPVYTANNPYISTASNVVTLKTDKTSSSWTTLIATLEGGSDFDQQNFSWQIEDSTMVQMFGQGNSCKMRAITSGTTRLIITHPKAEHPCYVLLICDEVVKSKCHISVPENIITMKPNDGERAITANLINGDVEDKYAFNWYADTYDVIELNYSANVASIKPIGQGQTTIHVTHPKAAYEQQIIVKVTEYTQFEFGMEYFKIVKGKTSFINMRVPITSVPCHVDYESLNPQICMIEGTSKVAQITALKEGNTKVKARLVATKTNAVQAETEILVNVEPAPADLVYISTQNTIHTIEKGTTKTLTAAITGEGITIIDGQNLKWKSSDPSTVKLTAASSTGIAAGTQCMLQALKAGECTVTVSHEKANTDLILKIIVPGTDEVDITLSKTYIRLENGGRTEIKAKLINAKPEDYKTIEWSIEKQNGNIIADILGKGETVAVFARNNGRTVLHARLPNGKTAQCDIEIEASRHISFPSQEITLEPGEKKVIKYTTVPDDVEVNWSTDKDSIFDYSVDKAVKTVTITAKKEGFACLTAITQYGNKTKLTVKCSWSYKFKIDKNQIVDEPNGSFVINYEVIPFDADIDISLTQNKTNFLKWNVDKQNKRITITPAKEGKGDLIITASNPRDDNHIIATRTCKLEFRCPNVTVIPEITSKNGNFSKYDNTANKIIIGDGENITVKFKPNTDKADIKIKNVQFESTKTSLQTPISFSVNHDNVERWDIKHPKDIIEYQYVIDKDIKAYYGIQVTNGGSHTNPHVDPDDHDPGYTPSEPTTNTSWYRCNLKWKWIEGRYNNGIWLDTVYTGDCLIFTSLISGKQISQYNFFGGELVNTPNEKHLIDFAATPCTPYIVSEKEFKNNPLWYKPKTSYQEYKNEWGKWILKETYTQEEKNYHNFKKFKSVSKDLLQEPEYNGFLLVEFESVNFSSTQKIKIPVYCETRGCTKNQ